MRTNIFAIGLLTSLTILTACNNEPKKDDTPPKELTADEKKYEQIKSDYELFGAWTINNSLSNSSYDYEIYNKGDDYIGVTKFEVPKFETLKKEGDKYMAEGNRFGEYYKVDNNKNMKLFDQDGDLTGSGYTAKKK